MGRNPRCLRSLREEGSSVNKEQLLSRLGKLCVEAGGQKAWATANGVSQQYVNDVLAGRREPGDAILDAMKIERIISYRPKP